MRQAGNSRNKQKQKSSGWRPADNRYTADEWQARGDAARLAQGRRDCDRLALWRACRVAHCRRLRGCTARPQWCMANNGSRQPENGGSVAPVRAAPDTPTHPVQTPRFELSAAEAAAAIAASVADALVDRADPVPDQELEARIRDGRIHHVPRLR